MKLLSVYKTIKDNFLYVIIKLCNFITGSEDEEEVPTRGYLKRQAQLVVDARARRKNVRMQRK